MTCDECGKHWIVRSCPCCGTDDDQCDDDNRNDDREYEEQGDRIDFDKEDFRWM